MSSGKSGIIAELRSGCKINLYLEITGVRADGYHTLRTFMLPLDEPFDLLRIRRGHGNGTLKVICAEPGIDPADNTLTKAHKLFLRERPALAGADGMTAELVKGVPHGAGLGGGSADAAAMLLYLNGLAQDFAPGPLPQDELIRLAAKVGADVPFFILNTPAWAEGIGDELAPAPPPWPELYIVLICPGIKISTARAFARWDERSAQNPAAGKTDAMGATGPSGPAGALGKSPCLTSTLRQDTNFSAAGFRLFNSLESVIFPEFPQLPALRRDLEDMGAAASLMSGSGSSVFGLFPDRQTAEQAADALRGRRLTVFTRSFHTGASPSW